MQTSINQSQEKATAQFAAQFAAHIEAARELLARLTAYADNHMEVDAEDVKWAHVGDAARLVAGLRNISDTLLPE